MPDNKLDKILKKLGSIENSIKSLDSRVNVLEGKSVPQVIEPAPVPVVEPVPEKEMKKPAVKKTITESEIGMKWLAWGGIAAVAIAAGSLVLYAIQNNWLTPIMQILMGVAIGILLLIVGNFLEKRNLLFHSKVFFAGGFPIIFYSLFAAHQFYEMVSFEITAFLILLVVIGAAYLAYLKDSKTIATEAFLLGYLLPLITLKLDLFLLAYSLILFIGILVLLKKKQWSALYVEGLALNVLIFWVWSLNALLSRAHDPLHALGFLFAFFVLFSISAVFFKAGKEKDLIGWLTYPAGFLWIALSLSPIILSLTNAFEAMAAALIFFALMLAGLFFYSRGRQNNLLYKALYVVAALFLFFNFSILFPKIPKPTFAEVFILEAILFAALALFSVFSISFALKKDKFLIGASFYLLSIFWFYFNIVELARANLEMEVWLFRLGFLGFFLVLTGLTKADQYVYSLNKIILFSYLAGAVGSILNILGVMVIATAHAVALAKLGSEQKSKNLLNLGLLVSVIAFISALTSVFVLKEITFPEVWESARLLSCIVSIPAFYFLWNTVKKEGFLLPQIRETVASLYYGGASLLVLLFITMEIQGLVLDATLKSTILSIAWILLAVIFLMVGFTKKLKVSRFTGISLFALAILKVFIFDLAALEIFYRIVSFFVLGIILLLSAFLYKKYEKQFD